MRKSIIYRGVSIFLLKYKNPIIRPVMMLPGIENRTTNKSTVLVVHLKYYSLVEQAQRSSLELQ